MFAQNNTDEGVNSGHSVLPGATAFLVEGLGSAGCHKYKKVFTTVRTVVDNGKYSGDRDAWEVSGGVLRDGFSTMERCLDGQRGVGWIPPYQSSRPVQT